jgi:hypothetical protein
MMFLTERKTNISGKIAQVTEHYKYRILIHTVIYHASYHLYIMP